MAYPSSRRRRIVTAAALVFALAAFPLGTAAIHQFNDVSDSNPFHNDIAAIANAGVTTGCGGGNYCPSAFVTREQMAAFMNRLGALGAGKVPVVNATTVDRYNAKDINRLARAASQALETAAATSANLTTAVTAPALGWLMVLGNAEMSITGENDADAIVCGLFVNDLPVFGASVIENIFQDDDLSAAYFITGDEGTCSPMGVFPICSATTYDVELRITSIGPNTDVGNAVVIAEYIPFDGNGQPPICVI